MICILFFKLEVKHTTGKVFARPEQKHRSTIKVIWNKIFKKKLKYFIQQTDITKIDKKRLI